MTTLVVVPMKDPAHSKTRLAPVLTAHERSELAKRLFCRTMSVLQVSQTTVSFDLAVVTASPMIRTLACHYTNIVIDEGPGGTLCASAEQAATWAMAHDYTRLGIIPADLAAPDADDVCRLLGHDEQVVVCPSLYDGTNALLTTPPRAIPFCYGPHSASRHLEAAHKLGLTARRLSFDSLRLDIDTSSCLSQALAQDESLVEEESV